MAGQSVEWLSTPGEDCAIVAAEVHTPSKSVWPVDLPSVLA